MSETDAVHKDRTDRLQEIGRRVTDIAIRELRDFEEQQRGEVQNLTVYFRPGYGQKELDFLWNAERTVRNHRTRYDICVSHADRIQEDVRRFLGDDPLVLRCFRDSPHFRFEPRRHVLWQSVTSSIVVQGNAELAELLRCRENVFAVDVDHSMKSVPVEPVTNLAEVVALGGHSSGAVNQLGYTWGWNHLGVSEAHKTRVFGEGLSIGIPDTGIYANHSDVILKVKDFRKLMPSGNLELCHSFDDDGHGTHVAGTCAGENNSTDLDDRRVRIGGAPRADLYGVAALQPREGGRPATGTWTGYSLPWIGSPLKIMGST